MNLGVFYRWIGWCVPASTITASLTLLVAAILVRHDVPRSSPEPLTFETFSISFGEFAFGYAGHATFPTLQTDMKQPAKFQLAVLVAFIGETPSQYCIYRI